MASRSQLQPQPKPGPTGSRRAWVCQSCGAQILNQQTHSTCVQCLYQLPPENVEQQIQRQDLTASQLSGGSTAPRTAPAASSSTSQKQAGAAASSRFASSGSQQAAATPAAAAPPAAAAASSTAGSASASNIGFVSSPLVALGAPPSRCPDVPDWFKQAVRAVNTLMATEAGVTILQQAIEGWNPWRDENRCDPSLAEVQLRMSPRRLIDLHNKGQLCIHVNYYENCKSGAYMSTFRHIQPASSGVPAKFVSTISMSSRWRTRAAAVADKEQSVAALRFGFFVKLMHEVMHSCMVPIMRAVYFGEEGWDPAEKSPRTLALHGSQGLVTPSRPTGVGWLDTLGLRLQGESGDQLELSLGLPGTLILHYDDVRQEVGGVYFRVMSRISSEAQHEVWTFNTFLCTPSLMRPESSMLVVPALERRIAAVLHPSSAVHHFLTGAPSHGTVTGTGAAGSAVPAMLAQLKEQLKPLQGMLSNHHRETLEIDDLRQEITDAVAAQQKKKQVEEARLNEQEQRGAGAVGSPALHPSDLDLALAALLDSTDVHAADDTDDWEASLTSLALSHDDWEDEEGEDEGVHVYTGHT